MKFKYVKPRFKKKNNPKVGLIALSTDLTIEKDFYSICHNLPIDVFVNRIHNYNPLTKKNLLRMSNQIEPVTKKILPGQKIKTIAYGCTSGAIAIGSDKIKKKINLVKPNSYVTTPIISTMKAIKKMKIKKIAIFTPYSKSLNKSFIKYFSKKKIEIISFSSFNLENDNEIGAVDPNYLLKVLSQINLKKSRCTFRLLHSFTDLKDT